jgi:phosphoribosylamine--glycine ligase
MTTADGIRVIEYNARLGDPEAINAMLLLQGDVAALLDQVASGELDPGGVAFAPQASLCKYLVPAGYPDDPGDPQTFTLDEERVNEANFSIIYASVVSTGNTFQTLGSRTLAIAGLGDEPGEISSRMEDLIARVEPQGLRHRKDVGDADVIRRKVNRMARLRGQRQD